MSEELKPCPFCNGATAYWEGVLCVDCGARIAFKGGTVAEHTSAWNSRAPDPRVKALLEATKAVSEGLEAHPDEPDRMLLTSSGFVRANKLLADLRVALAAMEE